MMNYIRNHENQQNKFVLFSLGRAVHTMGRKLSWEGGMNAGGTIIIIRSDAPGTEEQNI